MGSDREERGHAPSNGLDAVNISHIRMPKAYTSPALLMRPSIITSGACRGGVRLQGYRTVSVSFTEWIIDKEQTILLTMCVKVPWNMEDTCVSV